VNRRRRIGLILVASLATCGVALVVSCSFPDVEFATAGSEGGSGGEGGTGEGSTDSSTAADTAQIEASMRPDASTKVDAAGCTSCDCDGDHYAVRDGGCEGGPGLVYDCDDTDDFINPTRDFVDDFRWTSIHPVPFDWNCSGNVEKAYPINLACGGNVITGCTGGQGFKGDPSCGTGAEYFECKGVNGLCAAAKVDTRNQLCK
jgi:hypothetical protein